MAFPLIAGGIALAAGVAAAMRATILGDGDWNTNTKRDIDMADGKAIDTGHSLISPGSKFEWGGSIKGNCVGFEIRTHERNSKDSHTADNTAINVEGLVAQTVRGTIQKSPRPLYEVGTDYYYIVEGRPTGQGQISHIIGPNTINIWQQLANFANVCKCTDLVLKNESESKNCLCLRTENGTTGSVMFSGGLLQGLSVTANAQDFVLASDLTFMFFDLTTMNTIEDAKAANANAA